MTISYELAKQLKDAGYPLPKVGCHECSEGREWLFKVYYTPTLSELIMACGEDFYGLEVNKKKWRAVSIQQNIETYGSTPEEAVARLWLALQG